MLSSVLKGRSNLHCVQVTMYLNSPEIVVQPSVNDLKKVLGRLARNQVESSKPFVRWMSGTCIETPEVRGASDDDEPFVHTFFTDVSQNPQIVKTMLNLTQSTQKVIFGITRSATSHICCLRFRCFCSGVHRIWQKTTCCQSCSMRICTNYASSLESHTACSDSTLSTCQPCFYMKTVCH